MTLLQLALDASQLLLWAILVYCSLLSGPFPFENLSINEFELVTLSNASNNEVAFAGKPCVFPF